MNIISRINLYTWIKNVISEEVKVENKDINEIITEISENFISFRVIIEFNINMLKNIEEYFLHENINKFNNDFINMERFLNNYFENLNQLKNAINYDNSYIDQLEKRNSKIMSAKDVFYAFNHLINSLNLISNKEIDKCKFNLFDWYGSELIDNFEYSRELRDNNFNKVFLSYAFDDRLYSLCLFVYMLQNNIFLYVDWLFCPRLSSGILIKQNLKKELSESNQFLFLRSINSEFMIKGSGNVRGWCSWEFGAFYNMKKNNQYSKFFIELYKKKGSKANAQLDGVMPLKSFTRGKLK